MKVSEEKREVRKATLGEALLSFGLLAVIMAIAIIKYGVDPHVPMFCGVIVATLISLKIGYTYSELEQAMIDGITKAMQSALILMVIGILIGVWMVAGVVPSMIYYGLNILSPKIFLPATMIICSITSLATGTSWGTAGTMGIALIGIAQGLGIPAGITAGAALSGAYFGDKMSPLSDTTNLAPAMAGTDVFTHVKYMLKATGVSYLIAMVVFVTVGLKFGGGDAELQGIINLQTAIKSQFNVSPILMLPPVIVIATIAKKMPAIPGITLGVLIAAVMGPIFQGSSCDLGAIFDCGMNGYVATVENLPADVAALFTPDELDAFLSLLSKGGIMSMMFSVSMTIIAMMFGGVVEMTGQMEIIVKQILKLVRSDAGLVVLTEITCIFSNMAMPEQYISIVVPGRMYAQTYQDRGLHPKCLSNALESAGTVSGAFIPWHTCGVFMSTTLGVPIWGAGGYAPWLVFNYVQIVVTAVFAYLGITVTKMTDEEKKILAETGHVS